MLVLALMAALCSVAANESPAAAAAAAAAAAPPPEPHTSNRNLDDYRKIHAFFDAMQAPGNCTPESNCSGCEGVEYVWSDMGCGGGFAAHFQLAASLWLRAAAVTEYKTTILIIGQIWKYSEGPECKHVNGDWTCFFEKMAPCQDRLTKVGKQITVDVNKAGPYDERLIPEQFRHVGIAYWWGLVQERMWRMQPHVQKFLADEAARWFPGLTPESLQPRYLLQPESTLNRSLVPIAGMHVRHGDKKSDGFKHQSLEAQLEAVRHSKECLAHTATAVSSSSSSSSLSSSSSSSPSSGNEGRSAEEDRGEAERARCFTAEGKPLEIYVASDDSSVLTAAAAMGHLVDSDGVSQTTHGKGMLTTLWNDVSMGYNATLEIIRDITLLSRCSTVVGIAASQVFRMAVGMSNATGTLQGSVFAMDHGQIGRIGAMSNKFHIPLVEHFEKPP